MTYHTISLSCDELDIAIDIPVSMNFVIESSNVLNLKLPIPLLIDVLYDLSRRYFRRVDVSSKSSAIFETMLAS